MMPWILLGAVFLSLPPGATGHFVCMLGMVEAGPDCPLCHGDTGAKQPGPAVGNSCCKFVAGQSAMESSLSPAKIDKVGLTQASLMPPHVGFGLLVAPDSDLAARASLRTAPRTPPSGYLSNFLRL